MKVYQPNITNLGVGRVVEAYTKCMPQYGVEYVDDIHTADIITTHAGIQPGTQIDILHCHGLYPTAAIDTSASYLEANAYVIDNIRHAKIITVPSHWVAETFKRDMLLSPVVLPHGIFPEVFPGPTYGRETNYILWAKGHASGVCDSSVVGNLAARLPQAKFVTTFGKQARNTKVIGIQPYASMLEYIRNAGVYLATTKETFGIQTLEAMASGVPVIGYNWGATPDIVRSGIDGILVQPGDIDALAEAYVNVLDNWDTFSHNARNRALEFTWDAVCKQLYGLYEQALVKDEVSISVVIPCYNYANYLSEAIESVLQQTTPATEIIIVDDGSTDNTQEVAEKYPVRYFRIKNSGVANARNYGVYQATGNFVACLDADDKLQPNFISDLLPVIAADRSLGIVYGGIEDLFENGEKRVSPWPPNFAFSMQIHKRNCIPSCCMFRKAAWERAGGYKSLYTPAEDAELWTRITSYGYAAKKVTDKLVYTYRIHKNSLSHTRKEPDWVLDKPWSYDESLTPFAAVREELSFAVRNYDEPDTSVIIPVGPGHEKYAARAVDSVLRQSYKNWELLVVNDSGNDLYVPETGLLLQDAYPFIRLIESDGRDAGYARNLGVANARGTYIAYLDADDIYLPRYLELCVAECKSTGNYIYTDWYSQAGEKNYANEFSCEELKKKAIHSISIVLRKEWHDEIEGFDEGLGGWEDWDYVLRLACAGHTGKRVAELLLVYDYASGKRRNSSLRKKHELLDKIREVVMACRNCGNNKPRTQQTVVPQVVPDGYVMVIENSGNSGAHFVIGRATRINYGRHKHGDRFSMHPADQKLHPHLYVLQEAPVVAPVSAPTLPLTEPIQADVEFSSPPADDPIFDVVGKRRTAELPKAVVYEEPKKVEVDPEVLQSGKDVPTDYVPPVSTLQLRMLKNLTVTKEQATAMLAEETTGKKRSTVIAYLEELINA